MGSPFQHVARSAAGSVAEALYDVAAPGDDGFFFTVDQGRVVRVRSAELLSLQAAGFGISRIRQDQTPPDPAVPPVLAAGDPIEAMFVVPTGMGGVQSFAAQPIELAGGGGEDGTAYYLTIEQPGGAARAETVLRGQSTAPAS